MARTQRLIRVCTALAFICLLFAGGNAHAENSSGISATYYIINDAPPSKDTTQHTICGSEIENNINRSFDGEPFTPCPDDLFMVHYTGFITLPVHNTIQFWLAADDGGTMKIGTHEWGDWSDKGCGAIETDPMTMPSEQPLMLDGWFYENGGGTCFMLAWKIDDGDWEIVPDSAFTVNATATTTTTQEPTTTTTEAPTTTTSESPTTTNLQVTSPPTVVQTTVPIPVVVPVQTTVTTDPVVVPAITVPAVVPEPTVPVTMPASSVPVATVPAPSATDAPAPTLPLPTTTQPIQEPTSEPLSSNDPQILDLINNLDASTPEQITEAIESIVEAGITADAAAALATEPEILQAATADQAQEIFEALDIETLDSTQLEQLVAAVQDAPTEVREAFEEAINVFDGGVDSYVPVGSTVPVGTRRLVIAASALLAAVPVAPSRRN
jgi:hypothetical protein